MVHLDPRDERGVTFLLEKEMSLGAQKRPHDLGHGTASPSTAEPPDTFAYRLTTVPLPHTQNNHTVPIPQCGYNYINRDLRYKSWVVSL